MSDQKPDVETWMGEIDRIKIEPPVSLIELDVLYESIVKRGTVDKNWYQREQKKKLTLSKWIRRVSWVALLIGLMSPFVDVPGGGSIELLWVFEFSDYSQLGYVYLAFAGLVFYLDQLFLVTLGWTRFLAAEMEIRAKLIALRFDWKLLRAEFEEKDHENIPADKVQQALNLFKTFMADVHNIIKAETDAWATQLQHAMQALGERLKAQQDALEAKAEEAGKRGSLLIEIKNHSNLQGPVHLIVGSKPYPLEKPQAAKAIENLRIGTIKVVLTGTNANQAVVNQEKFAKIEENEVETVEFDIP